MVASGRGGAPAPRPDGLRGAARLRDRRHPEDGLLGLLPHRLGLHPLRARAAASRSGPGRGSAAGSARRLRAAASPTSTRSSTTCSSSASSTPSASRMPDIDIDFCTDAPRRGHRLRHARSTARTASRRSSPSGPWRRGPSSATSGACWACRYAEVDRIAKMIPAGPQDDASRRRSRTSPRAAARPTRTDPQVKRAPRHRARGSRASTATPRTHAAGVVIAARPLTDLRAALQGRTRTTSRPSSTWRASRRIGLLKMDFLGLRTLTVIDDCVKMLEAQRGHPASTSTPSPSTTRRPTSSSPRAAPSGVFQFESEGMRDILRAPQAGPLRGPDRHERALPPRADAAA